MALGLIRPPGPGSKDQRRTGAIRGPSAEHELPSSSAIPVGAAVADVRSERRGATGVEMAGQIAELARETLRSDFRSADPGSGRILLIEAADRALTAFPPSLSAKAERSHRKLGVIPVLGSTVVDVDETGVTIAHADDATVARTIRRLHIPCVDPAVGPFVGPNPAVLARIRPNPEHQRARVSRPVICRHFCV